MSIAAYNRGTRAIADQIQREFATRRNEVTVPALPLGWTVRYDASLISVENADGVMIHREPIPFRQAANLNRAVERALDPSLRHICPADGHALNGWQLHYA